MVKLTNGISVVHTGPLGVNTLIVELGGSYVMLVDPAACSYCGDDQTLISYLEKNGMVPVAVVLTHGHFDHVASLGLLKQKYPSIKIAIHKADSPYLGPESEKQKRSLYEIGFADFYEELKNLPPADCFLCDGKTLHDVLDGLPSSCAEALRQWTVISTPGHTKGSVCLYNKKIRTLISGDTIFYRSWGRTDLPDGSESEIQKSLNTIYKTIPKETLVFPGHDYYGFTLGENF